MGLFTTGLKFADVLGDLGGLKKLGEMAFGTKKEERGGEEMKGRPGQEHTVEGTIIEISAPYILSANRPKFLEDNAAAHSRVAIDFYRRNPALRDTYEKFLTQLPWWALSDGLGARTKQSPPQQPQAQQQQAQGRHRGQQPPKAAAPDTLDSDNVRLMMAFKLCLGMQANEADQKAQAKGRKKPAAAGDRLIVETIERMRQLSPFEQGKKALKVGGSAAADFLKGFTEAI